MSLNDPQWGKRGGGNEGPPDLDEMWRNFNQKLSSLFGRRRGGGSDPGKPPSIRQLGGGASLVILVVFVAWLASGFYIVVEGQRGVVLTFGRFSEVTSSGLRWRMPYPIQSNEIVNLSAVRTIEVGYRNTIKITVLNAAETALREVIGKSMMDFVLNQGQAVVAKALPVMQEILDRYQTGIQI